MSEHTPTPWALTTSEPPGQWVLCSKTALGPGKHQARDVGRLLASEADAAFIVLAVNCHGDLVKALEEIHPDTTEAVAQIVREALHPLRAKGEQP